MDYYRHTALRAKLSKLGIQAGKAVLQFEVSGEELYTLPTLALLTGEKVRLEIESDQQVLLIDGGTGEVAGEQAALEIEEAEGNGPEGADGDDQERDDDTEADELPPAAQAYDDELAGIFGEDAA